MYTQAAAEDMNVNGAHPGIFDGLLCARASLEERCALAATRRPLARGTDPACVFDQRTAEMETTVS